MHNQISSSVEFIRQKNSGSIPASDGELNLPDFISDIGCTIVIKDPAGFLLSAVKKRENHYGCH